MGSGCRSGCGTGTTSCSPAPRPDRRLRLRRRLPGLHRPAARAGRRRPRARPAAPRASSARRPPGRARPRAMTDRRSRPPSDLARRLGASGARGPAATGPRGRRRSPTPRPRPPIWRSASRRRSTGVVEPGGRSSGSRRRRGSRSIGSACRPPRPATHRRAAGVPGHRDDRPVPPRPGRWPSSRARLVGGRPRSGRSSCCSRTTPTSGRCSTSSRGTSRPTPGS